MKYSYPIAVATLFIGIVVASPAPLTGLTKRDPDSTKNLPSGNQKCDGRNYSQDDIKTAVNFGWEAVKDKKEYRKFSIDQ